MLILASTTDKIRLVTGSAGSVQVHVSWMDNSSGAIIPGRTNTPEITTATTTDIVPSPPGTVQARAIKTMHIHNHGTALQTVTVIHTDGTTPVELHRQILAPKETLQYIDEIGFKSINSVGEDSSQSRVLLANITLPAGQTNFILGPEVWSNPAYAAIECTHLIQVTGADDAPGFRISTDGGATYYGDLGQPGYGYAYHVGGGNSFAVGGSASISYGYLGTVSQGAVIPGAFPSTGRWILYGSTSSQVKTWLGQSGGYASSGGYVYNFWCWSGLPAITHIKFFWVNGGQFVAGSYFRFYGIK